MTMTPDCYLDAFLLDGVCAFFLGCQVVRDVLYGHVVTVFARFSVN